MSPVRAYSIRDLARRWGVAKVTAAEWTQVEGFPPTSTVSEGTTVVVDQEELHAWEEKRRAAGLPLPGEKRRGPKPRAESTDVEG